MWTTPRQTLPASPPIEESCSLAEFTPPTQQRHPTNPTKTKNPIVKNGETRRWTRIHQGDRESILFDRGHEALNKMPAKIEEEDQTRTERPVRGQESTKVEGLDIDFRVPGLSHAVVKEAEHSRVQELVKKIESHPHREALQADLQQNNVYNPFSNNSKAMIRELGNVELFELCKTFPKVQCSYCLLYWNQGIIYCTCGQFLVERRIQKQV